MTSFAQAWRSLVRRRAFTLTTIFTLAAGIAITTTMFSIVNGVLLRPLPYPDGAQVVSISEYTPGQRERVSLIAPVRLEDWNRLNRTFIAVSGSYTENVTDTSGVEPERLEGRRVLPRFFDVFGMRPLLGRTFAADEERFGGSTAVLISEALWTRRFARSPAAIGARLTIGGRGHTVVGVMPRAFTPAATDVWVPAQLAPGLMRVRGARFIGGVARMKPGVTVAEARADLARVQATLGEQYPASDKGWSADVRDLKEVRVGDYRRPLLLVFAAVVALFAIAVANAAGLLLAQLHRRAPEFAVRAAIGASRAQVVAAVMREVLLLTVGAAAAGAAASLWLSRMAAAAFGTIPRMTEIGVDARALAFVALITAAAAVLFGLIPAVLATRTRLAAVMSAPGRGNAGGRNRLQSGIVVAQLALGVALAGTAGLLLRSYGAMTAVDAGVDTSGVLTFHVGAAWDEDRVRIGELQVRLLDELARLPGVRAAGYASFLPGTGATLRSQVMVDGIASPEPGGTFTVGQRTVTAGYLRALSVPLAAGAWCAPPRANIMTPGVGEVMVNRRFVEQFVPGADAGRVLGRRLGFSQQGSASFRIVGVVGDVREDRPASPAVPYVYACLAAGSWPDPEYVVRADGDPRAAARAIHQLVKSIDPSRPIFALKSLRDVTDSALEQPRLNATLLGAFAAAALALAALGLYSLLMLVVAQRRRELGVRMALGASPRDLVRVVAAGAGRLVGAGIATGLVLTLIAGYLLRALLFGITPYDPGALAAALLALAVTALAAVIVPAHRAASLNAIDAMRAD
ncbi:MAG TPA: ADOP family duplicated permease [Vicinamibacterales bacterium]|nr:ADOP family duplicated permease [Vicinamibacterales bacterium]